jgi:hypothetical protein
MSTYTELLRAWRTKNPGRKFDQPASLHPTLHLAWNMALTRSFYHVGFYADKPGDHGYYPARAMDLRRKGWVGLFGFGFVAANLFAKFLWANHVPLSIDYVIVGRKIISRQHPTWRPYERDHSHDWHIHVSGYWPGKHDGASGGPRPGDH